AACLLLQRRARDGRSSHAEPARLGVEGLGRGSETPAALFSPRRQTAQGRTVAGVLRGDEIPAVSALPGTSSPDPRLWSASEPVVFFPVRHHSPACARLVGALIRELRPAAVLIEGPSDFNSRIGELLLDHRLPLAIYSYFATADGQRYGAFYPFFDFSPEWSALLAARDVDATCEFIDLPWAEVAPLDHTANRYADGRLGRSSYTAELARRLGVDDWSALWDTLFEIDADLEVSAFLQRCHSFCFHARLADGGATAADRSREAHMLERIRAGVADAADRTVLVVTGGFHSSALFAGLHRLDFERDEGE